MRNKHYYYFRSGKKILVHHTGSLPPRLVAGGGDGEVRSQRGALDLPGGDRRVVRQLRPAAPRAPSGSQVSQEDEPRDTRGGPRALSERKHT